MGLKPLPTDKDHLRDFETVYGSKFQLLSPKQKRHLMFMCCAALIFRWPHVMQRLPGHCVPDEALAIVNELTEDGLLTLIYSLAVALRCPNIVSFPVEIWPTNSALTVENDNSKS